MRWDDLLLKHKMFIAFSVVSLLIVGVTCFIFYKKNENDVKNQTFSLSRVISKQFSEMIDVYFENVEELSVAISIDSTVQSNLLNYYRSDDHIEKEAIGYRLNPILFNFSYPKTYVQGISIHTMDGQIYRYSKVLPPEPIISYSEEELRNLTEAISSNPFVAMPSREKREDGRQPQYIVSFIRKITKIPTQNIIGFVKIDVDVNAFKLVLSNVEANEFENSMYVLIVNDDGQVIFENNHLGFRNSNADLKELLNGIPPEGELRWGNTDYLYTVQKSGYTGWNTIIFIPKDVVMLKVKRFQAIIITVGIVTMLLIAAVSYVLSYHITLPLHRMMKIMSRVEQGDFHQRMEYSGNNEIGRLSRMYNLMLDSISRLINEVYESKLAEKNAQISALQAQINPHFLYNTLNIMKSISRLRGVEEVAEISESLAGLFQYSMKNLHHPVTLAEEIEHVNNYMKIQRHRFGQRLSLKWDIPDRLLKAAVLKLTIQPLVENAVNHGLKRKKTGGKIEIRAAESGGILTVTVKDNGEGMTGAEVARLQRVLDTANTFQDVPEEESRGIGLLNIHQRIQMYFGKSYGLKLFSRPGEGTKVTLNIPFITVKREGRVL